MLLQGKRYLVTGASASSAIGLSICQTLAQQGAKLILCARNKDSLAETKALLAYDEHVVAPFDLADVDGIPHWLKSLCKEHGALDGIVHSASYQGYSPLKMLSSKQIDQYFSINFSAAAMLLSGLSKKGCAASSASVVMVGSAAGLEGVKARALYAASKAALLSLVKTSALELADKKIRVNYVAPAMVESAKAQKQFATIGDELTKALIDSHPLGISTPEDVANTVLFLLSDMSRNTTGSVLPVDGGYLV